MNFSIKFKITTFIKLQCHHQTLLILLTLYPHYQSQCIKILMVFFKIAYDFSGKGLGGISFFLLENTKKENKFYSGKRLTVNRYYKCIVRIITVAF